MNSRNRCGLGNTDGDVKSLNLVISALIICPYLSVGRF